MKMADEEDYLVVIFDSSKTTVRAERALKEEGVDVRSIPCPRWLSLNCGIVLRIKKSDEKKVLGLLDSKGIGYDDVKPLRPDSN